MSGEGSEACEFPAHPNDPELIEKVLREYRTVAVVGISRKEDRPSYQVAQYLKDHGYRIVPVNPRADELLGEKAYHSLSQIPFPVDVVDVFRKPSSLPALAEKILKMDPLPKAVWFQIGVINNEATEMVKKAGIEVVQNRCMKIEHQG